MLIPPNMIITDYPNNESKIKMGGKEGLIDTDDVHILLNTTFHISESRKGDLGYMTCQ
jgi:hypothetical protein